VARRPVAVDVLLAVGQLVGPMPLVVSVGFMPSSILAVILGCLGLAEPLCRVGRLAIGPGGPLVPSGGALMLAPASSALVVLVVVGHSREPSSRGWGASGRATSLAAPWRNKPRKRLHRHRRARLG
jgi:hypothetical protein